MAYSDKQWLDAEGYYKSGLSLSQIETKTGIGRSTISKRAKKQQWQHSSNSDYIEAKVLIAEKKSTENQQLLNIADEVAENRIRHLRLINSNAELLASKIPETIETFTVVKIDKETGEQTTQFMLPPQDLRHLVEANDKLSITLKVNERHSPKVDINNNNLTQNNTKRVTIARRSDR